MMTGWIGKGGTSAAVAIVLGAWLATPASAGQVARAATPPAAVQGAAVEWAGFAGNAPISNATLYAIGH